MRFYLKSFVFFSIAIQLYLPFYSATAATALFSNANNLADEPLMIVSGFGDDGIIKLLIPEKFKTSNQSSLKGFFENLPTLLPKTESIRTYSRHNSHFHYPFVCFKFSHSKYTAEG